MNGWLVESAAEILAEKLAHDSLKMLTMHDKNSISLEVVLRSCEVSLQHLSVVDYGDSIEVAGLIEAFGSRLESLSFAERKRCLNSNVDMAKLISSCRGIKQLTLCGLHYKQALRALQAILNQRRVFRQITLMKCGLSMPNLWWFKKGAVEQQLLPVPKFVVEN